jgi:hypothetical protein
MSTGLNLAWPQAALSEAMSQVRPLISINDLGRGSETGQDHSFSCIEYRCGFDGTPQRIFTGPRFDPGQIGRPASDAYFSR